jgi:HEAT repeat protein
MMTLRWRVRTLAGLVVVVALGIKGVIYLRSFVDAPARREALIRLIRSPRPASAESTLVSALSDWDPDVRRTAAWALVEIGSKSPDLVTILVGELEVQTEQWQMDHRWNPRQIHPAPALKRMKLAPAIIAPLLRKAMASQEPSVRL